MAQLKTEFQLRRDENAVGTTSTMQAADWFRWESQSHADFVAIQVNMLLRMARRRGGLAVAETRD